MYSKKETSQLRQEFWTAFGYYMSPVLSAEGEKINWVNYRTGEKDIFFRMNADNKLASIGIEITHKDAGLRAFYFEQFIQIKSALRESLREDWTWIPQVQNEYGKMISFIFTTLENKSILERSDWPELITFFKPRIIALNQFWIDAKYWFEVLR